MAIRELNNIGQPFLQVNGEPLAGVKIVFTLVASTGAKAGRKVLAFSTPSNSLVVGRIEVVTNNIGEFTAMLTPNDTISPSTMYLCVVEGLGSFKGIVESGGGAAKKFVDFFTLGG